MKELKSGKCYEICCMTGRGKFREGSVYIMQLLPTNKIFCEGHKSCSISKEGGYCRYSYRDLVIRELNEEETILFKLEYGL